MIISDPKINNLSEGSSQIIEAGCDGTSSEIKNNPCHDLEKGILDNKCGQTDCSTKKIDKTNPKTNKLSKKIRLSNNNNIFLTLYTIIGYFFTSIAIIYYNHWLFDKVAPYPVFATWVQQIVGVICFGILSLSRRTPNVSKMNKSQPRDSTRDNVSAVEDNEVGQANIASTNCTSNENISAKELGASSNRIAPSEISFQNSSQENVSLPANQSSRVSQIAGVEESTTNKGKKQNNTHFRFETELKKLLKILPMSICFVGLVAFGNICLKYVQVSTYQLARSGSLIFTVIVSYFMLGQKQTWQSILACIVVCAGFLIGSLDRSSLSAMGIITGLASSFCQVFYNVFMKKCMNYFDGDAIQLMKYNQCISTILLIPCIFIAQETNLILDSAAFNISQPEFFRIWVLLVLCGLLSMLLNYFTFLVVGYTSPVTFNVLGMFKSCAQTAGGFIIFHDHASVHTITGICLTLAGSVWYGFAKSLNCNSRSKSAVQSDTGSDNGIVICKTEFEQKTSILKKELSEVGELCYSSDANNENKIYNDGLEDFVDNIHSYSGVEMAIISSKMNKCESREEGPEIKCDHEEIQDDYSGISKDCSSENITGLASINSYISNGKQESQYTENTLTTKTSEQKDLEKLFEKFANISRENSTDLRSSMSKISASLPASVYASPIVESRQISVDAIPNNAAFEESNDNISLDVSIIVESEREVVGNSDDQELTLRNCEASDEDKSTIIAGN
ncbi:putative translocator [Cryptosporidium canis]|uniref:Translocator n=1 Tax=Cryptosporidium canis TaxID=195482 RepID=A0ABQ8P6B1_9CRYT|nr:putative translocator [Cryptosporidium canis]